MDIRILKQYIHLVKEEEETQSRIERIISKIDRINSEGNVQDVVKGGNGNLQVFHIEGFPVADEDEARYLLAKQKRILEERRHDIQEKAAELEQWLNALDDSRMRRIITKHYIEGKAWHTVAREMGKNYTEDSCKQLFSRFMKQFDKKI